MSSTAAGAAPEPRPAPPALPDPAGPADGPDGPDGRDGTSGEDQADRVLRLLVDGERVTTLAPPQATLLEVLRYRLGRTGTRQGCDRGDCGACTVLLDGRPVLACLTLAALCEGRDVRTVEGLRRPEGLHPLQEAFLRHGAAQCGFCTGGVLMTAAHFLESRAADAPPPTRAEVAAALAGNLCRCTGYVKILDAVVDAAAQMTLGAPR